MLVRIEEAEYDADDGTIRLHNYVEPKSVIIFKEHRLWLLYRIPGPDWTYKSLPLPFDLEWLERNDETITKHYAWRLYEKLGPLLSYELNHTSLSPGVARWFNDLRKEINTNKPAEDVAAIVLEVKSDRDQPGTFDTYGGSSIVNRIGLVPMHLHLAHLAVGSSFRVHYERGCMIFNPAAQIHISEHVPVPVELYDDQFSYYPGCIITQPGEMFVWKFGDFEYVGNMHESLSIPLDIKEIEAPERLKEIHDALVAGEYKWVSEMDTIDEYVTYLLEK
jgi:hypothetical protein